MKRNEQNECWACQYKEAIPGNAHLSCSYPDREMTGDEYGIKSGWFFYPFNFDPIWKTKECSNFQQQEKNK